MNTDAVHISLRLADGQFFPVLLHGNSNNRCLKLVPAHNKQKKIQVHFFYYKINNSNPIPIGILKLSGLPASGEIELELNAKINSSGLFSACVTHGDSGYTAIMEADIPLPDYTSADSPRKPRRRSRWFTGLLFVIISLLVILGVAFLVANWGNPQPYAEPVSAEISYIPTVPVLP